MFCKTYKIHSIYNMNYNYIPLKCKTDHLGLLRDEQYKDSTKNQYQKED